MSSPALNLPHSLSVRSRLLQPLLIAAAVIITLLASAGIGATQHGYVVFGLVLSLVIAMGILIRPELGIYILVVFIFANLSDVLEIEFGVPDSNKFLVGLIAAGTFVSWIMMQRRPIIFQTTEMLILGFGLVLIASLYFSPDSSGGISLATNWFKDFAIIMIIIQFSSDDRVWRGAQWALIFTAAVLASLSVYQMLTGDFDNTFFGLANAPVHQVTEDFDSNRVTGPVDDPNYYAMFLTMVLPIALYRFLSGTNRVTRLLGLVTAAPILLTILFTYSRGAFLALVIVGILITIERQINPYKFVPVILIAALVIVPMLPTGFGDRLATLTGLLDPSATTERSLRGRSSEVIVAFWMFQDYPILGVGWGNYEENYLNYSSRLGLDTRYEDRQAHSMYLEVAAETGVVGLVVFGAMIAALFLGMHYAKRTLRTLGRVDLVGWVNGIQFGLIGYLSASLFLHADYIRYFWLIAGLAASCHIVSQTQKERHVRQQIASDFSSSTQV